MLHAFLTFATEAAGEESSKIFFYVAGGLLAAYAVVVSALGITRPDFPGSEGAGRAVMGLSAVLVAVAMASAVVTG